MVLIEDMIDLHVPLFPIGGFTGSEKILAAVTAANPSIAGDIQPSPISKLFTGGMYLNKVFT